MIAGARRREGKGMHSPGWGGRVDHLVLSHPAAAPSEDERCKTSYRKSLALWILETKGMSFSSYCSFSFVYDTDPQSKPITKHSKL